MIASLGIQNLQSHESTHLEFHRGLNLIVGQGDSGKSAIHRAIRWCQSNRIRHDDKPMADSFISDWAKSIGAKGAVTLLADCKVTVTKPEGVCSRFRKAPKGKGDKERNGYDLNGQRFEAIGVSVPDQVSEFVNWSEVNVQRQHDQAFLLSKGAGEVASFLNRTVRLDAIDSHVQAANSLLRAEKAALVLLQSKQADDMKAVEALSWVPAIEARLQEIDTLDKSRTALRAQAQRLHEIGDQIAVYEGRIRASERIASMEPRVKELRRLNDWRRGIMEQRNRLREHTDLWKRWAKGLCASTAIVIHAPKVQGLREQVAKMDLVDERRRALVRIRAQWDRAEEAVRDTGAIIGMADKVLELRGLVDARKVLSRDLVGIRDLVERWSVIRVADVAWEPLERMVRVLRARMNRVAGIREQIAGIQSFRLTFADLSATIQGAGERVAELVAMRPETCPLCGGPMHKGEH